MNKSITATALLVFFGVAIADGVEIKMTPQQLKAEQAKEQKILDKQMAKLTAENTGTKPIEVYMAEHGIFPTK
jgi:hypothetical protein